MMAKAEVQIPCGAAQGPSAGFVLHSLARRLAAARAMLAGPGARWSGLSSGADPERPVEADALLFSGYRRWRRRTGTDGAA